MNKKFLMALMLASGMALAQSGGSSGSMDQQQPPAQQTQPSGDRTATSTEQSALTGCLKGSGDAWVLIAEGQTTPVTGDSSTLKPHNGHQVQVKGTPASDGSFQVTDVVMIADTCTNQQSDASSGAGAVTGAAAGAVTGAAAGAVSAGASAAPSTGGAASTAQSTAPALPAAGESASATAQAKQKLPQTASPLPLLGLLGLGSLVTGLIARRKK